jgi:hypothetical protein
MKLEGRTSVATTRHLRSFRETHELETARYRTRSRMSHFIATRSVSEETTSTKRESRRTMFASESNGFHLHRPCETTGGDAEAGIPPLSSQSLRSSGDRLRPKDATNVIGDIAVPSALALVAQMRDARRVFFGTVSCRCCPLLDRCMKDAPKRHGRMVCKSDYQAEHQRAWRKRRRRSTRRSGASI